MIAQEKDQRLTGIGQRLRDFRKQQGYRSQEAFAADVGSTRAAIAAYEIGKVEPTGAFLHNLSTKFGVDINYILTGKSEQEMPDFDTYLTRMGVDDTMKAIVTGYMALPPDKRKTVKEYIESLAAEIAAKKVAAAAKDEEPPTPVDKPPADAPPDRADTVGAMANPAAPLAESPPGAPVVSESVSGGDGVPPAPPYPTPPGLELDPDIEDKVKKIRAKLYAQAATRRMFTTSPSTEDASENKKSRP